MEEEPIIEWEHPDLAKIEHRTVNKELEVKRALVNVILLLISKLGLNLIKLVMLKLEITFDYTNANRALLLFQLLFVWNIASGLFRAIKPQDEFKDLNLTPHQRELLGLKDVPVTYAMVDKVTSVKPTTPTRVPEASPIQSTNQSTPRRKTKTPIASPMASQTIPKLASPRKSRPLKPTTSLDPLKGLKEQIITPTYIPSPKYYYRMDSPTKSRRRV
jgi:nucleoporin POM34